MWGFNEVDQPEGRGEPHGLYPSRIDTHHHPWQLAMVSRQHLVGSRREALAGILSPPSCQSSARLSPTKKASLSNSIQAVQRTSPLDSIAQPCTGSVQRAHSWDPTDAESSHHSEPNFGNIVGLIPWVLRIKTIGLRTTSCQIQGTQHISRPVRHTNE